VFVNAILWMKEFDGAVPIVRKTNGARAREWALVTAGYRFDAKQGIPEWQTKQFDAALWKEAGNLDRLEAILGEKLPMIRLDAGRWTIDADLVTLGIGSRDPKLLEQLEKADRRRRERRARAPRAAPLRADVAKLSAAELRAWRAKNHARLFFSDVGGYRWIVGPARD